MCSFIPLDTYSTATPEYEGIQMDAFFFARTTVGLPAKPATLTEDDEYIGFTISELKPL